MVKNNKSSGENTNVDGGKEKRTPEEKAKAALVTYREQRRTNPMVIRNFKLLCISIGEAGGKIQSLLVNAIRNQPVEQMDFSTKLMAKAIGECTLHIDCDQSGAIHNYSIEDIAWIGLSDDEDGIPLDGCGSTGNGERCTQDDIMVIAERVSQKCGDSQPNLIVTIGSTAGGTSSGGHPILIKYLVERFPNTKILSFIIGGFKVDQRVAQFIAGMGSMLKLHLENKEVRSRVIPIYMSNEALMGDDPPEATDEVRELYPIANLMVVRIIKTLILPALLCNYFLLNPDAKNQVKITMSNRPDLKELCLLPFFIVPILVDYHPDDMDLTMVLKTVKGSLRFLSGRVPGMNLGVNGAAARLKSTSAKMVFAIYMADGCADLRYRKVVNEAIMEVFELEYGQLRDYMIKIQPQGNEKLGLDTKLLALVGGADIEDIHFYIQQFDDLKEKGLSELLETWGGYPIEELTAYRNLLEDYLKSLMRAARCVKEPQIVPLEVRRDDLVQLK